MDLGRVAGRPDPVGQYRYDVADQRWTWSAEVYAMHGLAPEDCGASTELVLRHVHPVERSEVLERFRAHLAEPGPYSSAYRLVDDEARVRSVGYVGESFAVDGGVAYLSNHHNIRLARLADQISERMDSPRYSSLEPKATPLAILTDVANPASGKATSVLADERILPA